MKVSEVNIGNGIVRLDFEPTCPCERNFPTHVMDSIAKDIFKRRQNGNTSCTEVPSFSRPTFTPMPQFNPCPSTSWDREPDGIDVHVDRPLRENFSSHRSWADAMAKYRTLERVAKDCDWECKEPMQTIPNYRNLNTRIPSQNAVEFVDELVELLCKHFD